jgi:hypothetical protein
LISSVFSWRSYAEVRSPGYLHIYKDKATADANRFMEPARSSDPTATVVDLRIINRFYIPERKNKDNTELDIELSDETIRLK